MRDAIYTAIGLLLALVAFAIHCMIYALPVMLGIFLWNLIF